MSILHAILEILTLNCSEAAALASEDFDRRLTRAERIALGIHVAICAGCRRYRRQILLLRRALSRLRPDDEAEIAPLPAPPTLSPQARERIKQALRGEEP